MLRVKGQAATEGFAIEHFAGSVTYTTKLWLDKNKDPLNLKVSRERCSLKKMKSFPIVFC